MSDANKPKMSNDQQDLRRRAEEIRLERTPQLDKMSQADLQRIFHELEVHQIELEMQNEELRRVQQELESSREKYFDLYDLAPVGYVTCDEKGIILESNLSAALLFDVERKGLIGQPLSNLIYREDQDLFYLCHKRLVETQTQQVCEMRILRRDGDPFWVRIDIVAKPVLDSTKGFRVVIIDISERKRSEAELNKVNRALKTISKCNEVLVHAVDESAFLQKICDLLIEEGGYRMAWIGYQGEGGDKRVLPLVHAGHEDGYLSAMNATWQDVELGQGSAATAIRTRSCCIHNDICTHPDFIPLREEALKRGYSSAIAFPLVADEQCFGVLTIYASERDVFIDGEIKLLKELADDLAFGILMIRMRVERRKGQEELRRSHEQLHSLAAHQQSVREEERANIAREVHDELGQILTALKFNWSGIAAKLKNINEPLYKAAISDVELIDRSIQTVKKICTELRPGILDHLGLGAAIEWQVNEFQDRSGIKCELVLSADEVTDDKKLGIVLFRILQEALTNILRHSKATNVRVALAEYDDSIMFEISDNGIGITEDDLSKSTSFGLIGMRERVYPWKGEVMITGDRSKGTTIKISIPKDKT